MRTRIEIDERLLERAMRLTGASTAREVVDLALHRLVDRSELCRRIRRLRGRLHWEGDVHAGRVARKPSDRR